MERTYNISGLRRHQQRIKRQNDYTKSLPLPIRKAIKRRDAALAAYNAAVVDGDGHAKLVELRRDYEAIRDEVDRSIGEL